jgi:protein phosphatase inhibitor 2
VNLAPNKGTLLHISAPNMTTEPPTTIESSSPAEDVVAAAAAVLHPVKPALSNDGKKKSKQGRKKKGDVHLKWDEDKIKEHDQLRGTRMKIDEPNTPYHQYDSGSETDGSIHSAKHVNRAYAEKTNISWDTLQTKLEAHAAVREAAMGSPSSSRVSDTYRSDGEGEEGAATAASAADFELRQLEFKEHRKRHYNEMELVRKYRQEHANGDKGGRGDLDHDEDDGGDEADDEHDE